MRSWQKRRASLYLQNCVTLSRFSYQSTIILQQEICVLEPAVATRLRKLVFGLQIRGYKPSGTFLMLYNKKINKEIKKKTGP